MQLRGIRVDDRQRGAKHGRPDLIMGQEASLMSDSSVRQTDALVELSTAAGGLAHEFRNVLSTLRMNLQLLDEDWNDLESRDSRQPVPPETIDVTRRSRKRVAVLLSETRRLETIIDDFLQFARRRELKRVTKDLVRVAGDIVEFFRPQAEANDIAIELTAPPDEIPVSIDASLLKQALLNLLMNALQAIGSQGRLAVSVGKDENGGGWIDIEDSGPGISSEQVDRIFEAYYSTKKGGTGLGLTMARQIIRAHGGHITVDSVPGKGSRFRVYLPPISLTAESSASIEAP